MIDLAQLHGNEDASYLKKLREKTKKPLIQAVRAVDRMVLKAAEQSTADYIMADSGAGTGKTLSLIHIFDKGKKVCRGIRIPECVTDEWTIDEPVVVREEVNADGEKYYSYSGQQESDGRNSGKERNTQNPNGSVLPGVYRPRRTVIKL